MANLKSVKTLAKTKVPKWKPFMQSGEVGRWKREGSPESMISSRKRAKSRRRRGNWGT